MQTCQPMFVYEVEPQLYPNCPPVQHPATMSTDPMSKCTQCRSYKMSNGFGMHQRGYSQPEGDCPKIEGSLHVSLAGMTTLGKGVADYIASLPGGPLGTDLGMQCPQHLLAGCSGSYILQCTSNHTLHLSFLMYIIFYICLLIKLHTPVHCSSVRYQLDISYNCTTSNYKQYMQDNMHFCQYNYSANFPTSCAATVSQPHNHRLCDKVIRKPEKSIIFTIVTTSSIHKNTTRLILS